METNQRDRLPSAANVEFWSHSMVQAVLVLVLCYLAASLGGILIITVPQTLWPLWPGCAVLVAIPLVSPRRAWPILIPAGLAGFVVYDLPAGVPIHSIAVLQLADIAEILVVLWGVDYFLQGVARLDSLKALAKYVFVTAILGPLVVCLTGSQALTGDRWISGRIAFLSDGLAFLTLAPAILGWVEHFRARPRPTRAYYLEAAALFTAVFSLSSSMFVAGATHASPAVLYSLVPLLLWSALRFGSAGAGGGMLESGVGRAHNIAMSSLSAFTLPGDVSASQRYWDEDIIDPEVEVSSAGTITVPEKPGLGYRVRRDRLDALTVRSEMFRASAVSAA